MKMARHTGLPRERLLKHLRGSGIEIGALHRPVPASHLSIRYVDRLKRAQLYDAYPELKELPVVETDILDDAETLATIPDDTQDFVIANHVIEHMRNPLAALLSWRRVLKPHGRLFMAVPDKHLTFDREREITPLSHVIDDYLRPDRDRDHQAFLDFALFVSCRVFHVRPEGEAKVFADELAAKNYSIHFHVWDKPAFDDLLRYMERNLLDWRMRSIDTMPTLGDEFAYVLEKQA
jgi:SAM-dependent methyltransferase